MQPRFRNRTEAGRLLAQRLRHYPGQPDLLVLALPRGGVPVAYEVAKALKAPLDVFLVRKLGLPGYEELAMGAVASGGIRVINASMVGALRISEEELQRVVEREAGARPPRAAVPGEQTSSADPRANGDLSR